MKNQFKTFIPAFLLGFLALSFQIILMREFSAHFFGNEIMFGILLGSWLLWTGAGSIYASRMEFTLQRFQRTYYMVIVIMPFCLAGLRFSRFLMQVLPGEITGTLPALFFSLILTFLICFPLGVLFVFNVHHLHGNLKQAYFTESIGSAIAGIVIYFVFIPLLSNWRTLAFLGGCAAVCVFFSFGIKKNVYPVSVVLLVLTLFWTADLPSQKFAWRPFSLIESQDSPYGKLQMLKYREQISLYNNSMLVYSYPDYAAAEESVHFSLLQFPEAEDVLLVGGGIGGALGQILKYPKVHVDYVELDPEIIHLSLKHLPDQETKNFRNPRVHIYYSDGRAFLQKHQCQYDVIILDLPEPASAQINRFYTKEFFIEIRKKLSPEGIFSFRVPSAENYISSELQGFLASLYLTLNDVFPCIEIVPGSTNIFIASSRPVSLELKTLNRRINDLKLNNLYVSPQLLSSRLDPLRVELLKDKVQAGKARKNFDLTPISYFFNSVLWSAQFQGIEAKLLSFLSGIQIHWFLDLSLILFIAFGFVTAAKRKKSHFLLTPLAVMGLTTIVSEIVVIIAFQSFYGYLYRSLAFLFASFMFGLSAGAFLGLKRKKIHSLQLLLAQFVLLLFILLVVLDQRGYRLFSIILFALGFLGGDLFIIANHLFLKNKINYGIGYGLDLIGSFLGAMVTSALLIPLLGLVILVKYLLILNSLCVVFLFWGFKKQIT